MRSSTVPPSSSQHRVYCALPVSMRPRSLVRHWLTKSAAPVPRTSALPRWLTSNRPTASRTALCSASTPPPAYSSGMSQPPNSASLAPRATWRSCNGECSRSMAANLEQGRARSTAEPRVADMLSVTLSTAKPTTARADALILGIRGDDDKGDLAATLDLLGFTGEKGQTVTFPAGDAAKASLVVAVALPEQPTAEDLRRATARGIRGAKNATTVAIALHPAGVDEVEAIAEGAQLGSYSYDTYKTKKKGEAKKPKLKSAVILSPFARQTTATKAVERAAT